MKFNVGGGYTLAQGHFITFDQACNPDFDNDARRVGSLPHRRPRSASGDRRSRRPGIPNPNYRRPINDPGHRFKVDDLNALDVWINATVMF